MSMNRSKVAQPVVFTEQVCVKCDSCGTQSDALINGGLTVRGGVKLLLSGVGPLVLGWFLGFESSADPENGGIDVDSKRIDYCPECWPKIQAAGQQEVKAIAAEKLEAAAKVSGVSA